MEEEAPAFALARSGGSVGLWALVSERIKSHGLARVGFESQHLTVDMHSRLRTSLPTGIALEATSGLVEDLRMRKTEGEVAQLRQVAEIAGRAYDRIRASLRPGLRERDVAFLLEQTYRELGADGASFETIVAAGEARRATPWASLRSSSGTGGHGGHRLRGPGRGLQQRYDAHGRAR